MQKLLIIKTGATFADTAATHGDFEHMFSRGLGLDPKHIHVHAAASQGPLPDPMRYCGVLVTGAHSMVTDGDRWIERLGKWLHMVAALEKPILGVCYGHQLLGQAFGGRAGPHPKGLEVGTVEIARTAAAIDDPLFNSLPESFPVHVTHRQSILELPYDTVVLAANAHDPHQAIRIDDRVWGVQFHPEFSPEITRDYINRQRAELQQQGQAPEQLLEQVRETADSHALLRRFAAICGF